MTAPLASTASHSGYGGDAAGLICGYLMQTEGVQARPLDSAEAAQWLEQHAGSGSAAYAHTAHPSDTYAGHVTGGTAGPAGNEPPAAFVWLHFNLAHAQAVRWMQRHAQLPDAFFEALKDGSYSTRIERDDDALMGVLNDAHFDFAFEPFDIATLWICVLPHLVITARAHPLRSVDALRTAVRQGHTPRSSVALLEQLMRTQAAGLVDIVRGVTQRIDSIEDELLAGRLNHKRARLGVLRRLLVRLQRLLAPEPAALFRLLAHPPHWMGAEDVQELRDSTEEFSVVLRDMQGLQERIKLLQEELAASVQEANSRSLFVLTVVTVLALPINILTGLLGMNVGGIPLAGSEHGFWVIVGILVVFTAVAGWLALRGTGDN